ncbi:flap endonuclease-1 [Methanolobus psychrophilus R15]|nr:flap endonuclease-1 [Methanolobus psychrophilus R15]
MGVDLGDLLKKKPVELSDLSSKVIAIDAYNTLYQFLSIIRQKDGTPLKDSKGNITSHLSGLLYRMSSLMEAGIRPVFVFDGKPPQMKSPTIEKRVQARENAQMKWEQAQEEGLAEEAYKYAQASSRVDATIVEDSRKLLNAMGIPFLDAPSEGEAQAAYMVIKRDADYAGSQDYDSLLFGAPRVVRNLTVSGKRKLPKKNLYVDVKPEVMELEETLLGLDVTREQLIDIALCVGTDYNQGITNIGPKKALKLVKEHGSIEKILASTGNEIPDLGNIKDFFMNPPVTKDYGLNWKKPKTDSVLELLCDEHDFSRERVSKALEKLEVSSGGGQKTLDNWF